MRSNSPKKPFVKPPSPMNSDNLTRKSVRWGLAFVSALLVLMQMSSSFGIYENTVLVADGESYDQVVVEGRRTQMHEVQSVSMDDDKAGDRKATTTTSRQSHREAIAAKLETSTVRAGTLANANANQNNLQARTQELEEKAKEAKAERKESTSGHDNDAVKKPATATAIGAKKPTNHNAKKSSSGGIVLQEKPHQHPRPFVHPRRPATSDRRPSPRKVTTVLQKPKPKPIVDLAYSHPEAPHPLGSTRIRRWGCARNETPFVFVHIGKAGGGGVRARIAAAARDFNRTKWHEQKKDPSYYYPVYDDQGNLHRGKLISSEGANMLPHFPRKEREFVFQRTFRFEGSSACHSDTPIGHAIACHFEKDLCDVHRGTGKDHNRCDVVYMGHNVIGGEMNFLPTGWLVNWWTNTTWGQADAQTNDNSVATKLENRYNRSQYVFAPNRIAPEKRNCADGPFKRAFQYNRYYEKCVYPETKKADVVARAATQDLQGNWGPLYASMPVNRVTMLREPFSWLKSKFFWMENHMDTAGKPATVLAYKGDRQMSRMKLAWDDAKRELYANATFVKCDDVDNFVNGWGKQGALEYIFYLCGEHCMGQWQTIEEEYGQDAQLLKTKHLEYLRVMEETASYNLRNSFAVVGLLEETDQFFDMITQRVLYMDTSLNPEVRGESHSSGKGPEQMRCSQVFKQESFRKEILDKGPEVAASMRLYELGLQVNKFQKEELEQCSKPY